jgi:hypothetical protein
VSAGLLVGGRHRVAGRPAEYMVPCQFAYHRLDKSREVNP